MMLLASTAMALLASMYDQSKFLRAEDLTAAKTFVPMLACAVDAATAGPRTGTLQDLMASHPENRFSCLGWLRFPSFWPF
jgi:hypothetical protein